MIRSIPKQLASKLAITILGAVVIFHLLVISGIIPGHLVWGGRLQSSQELYLFESISIVINLLIITMILAAGGTLPFISRSISRVFMWLFFGLFTLNTMGNLMAVHSMETIIFTPITLILALLTLRLALKT